MMEIIYRFERFELRSRTCELRRDGMVVKVEPKPLEFLLELLQSPGQVVTKSELMDRVWTGRIVTESVITQCVKKLRDALDDDAQTLIVSVHGYGYRFTAPVSIFPDADGAAVLALTAGDVPPLRPNWRLVRPLDEQQAVWLIRHKKTHDQSVLKFGMTLEQIQALRREVTIQRLLQQALGEHKGIVRLVDYNLESPPYFLEIPYFSDGNLVDWCGAQGGAERIPVEERVAMLAQLAAALGAAHALGVLHQDIKPSNVLVRMQDGKPQLVWADFGSGRLLAPERLAQMGITRQLSTATLAGPAGLLEGTLHYVAPELFRGEAPTIRSDLYAMGVLLYQLICGDLRRPVAVGWEQNVGDELLRADVAATANDDPGRRLSSADELALRLSTLRQRREALTAQHRRDTQTAQLQSKLERVRARRPWLVAACLALCLGTAFSLWSYRAVRVSRDEARAQAAIADAVIEFLDRDILAQGSPFSVSETGTARLTVREAVDRAAAKLDGRFANRPAVEASIRAAIGQVYVEDGDYAAAEFQVRKAIELGHSAGGAPDERALRAEYGLAFALSMDQKFTEARRLLDEADRAVDLQPDVGNATKLRRDVINGNYYLALQEYARAIPYFERAMSESTQGSAADVSGLAIRETSLAWCYAATGAFDKAEPLYKAALGAVRRAEQKAGTLTGTIEERYGIGLFLAARDDQAEAMLRAAHAHLLATIGEDGLTAEALTFLGWLELRERRLADAEKTLREAYREAVPGAGADHRITLRALACLGLAELENGAAEAGSADLRNALQQYDRVLGPQAPETQFFRYMWLAHRLATHDGASDSDAAVNGLSAQRIANAAPWEDWNAHLREIKSGVAAPLRAR